MEDIVYVMLDANGDILKWSTENFSDFDEEVHSIATIENFEASGYVSVEKNDDGNIVGITDIEIMERLTPPPE
jgi:hypothetical protein